MKFIQLKKFDVMYPKMFPTLLIGVRQLDGYVGIHDLYKFNSDYVNSHNRGRGWFVRENEMNFKIELTY